MHTTWGLVLENKKKKKTNGNNKHNPNQPPPIIIEGFKVILLSPPLRALTPLRLPRPMSPSSLPHWHLSLKQHYTGLKTAFPDGDGWPWFFVQGYMNICLPARTR